MKGTEACKRLRILLLGLSIMVVFGGVAGAETLSGEHTGWTILGVLLGTDHPSNHINFRGTLRSVARAEADDTDDQAVKETVTVREIVHSVDTVYLNPDEEPHKVYVYRLPNNPMEPPLEVTPELLLSNYEIRLEGIKTQAGRTCVVARAIPRHAGRDSIELWIDIEKGMILKRVYRNPAGEIFRTLEFTAIEYDPSFEDLRENPEAEVIEEPYWGVVSADRAKEIIERGGLRFPAWVPEGFRLLGVTANPLEPQPEEGGRRWTTPKIALWYSDGLASFNIVVFPFQAYLIKAGPPAEVRPATAPRPARFVDIHEKHDDPTSPRMGAYLKTSERGEMIASVYANGRHVRLDELEKTISSTIPATTDGR